MGGDRRAGLARATAALLAAGLGCAALHPAPEAELPAEARAPVGAGDWSWFRPAPITSIWTRTVSAWQERQAEEPGPGRAAAPLPPVSALDAAYRNFRADRRRELAEQVARWVRERSQEHFVGDEGVDHWPTFDEMMARGRDDCDGLALVALRMLHELGFGAEPIYQGIVRRHDDGMLHMVTLWFEKPEDPWVIDPTGAMTEEFVRFSELPGWEPLHLFTEGEQWAVRSGESPLPPVAAGGRKQR